MNQTEKKNWENLVPTLILDWARVVNNDKENLWHRENYANMMRIVRDFCNEQITKFDKKSVNMRQKKKV